MAAPGCSAASLPRLELLIGAEAFWARAAQDIAAAKRRVLVQAMSFEADTAGLAVAGAIAASRAADRRVLVDDYTRLVINDVWVKSKAGRANPAVQAEAAATAAMVQDLANAGAPVRVTNPIGRWKTNYPARNHKKMIVADDVAYIGGVNFCDHNFLWHDLMLRLEGAGAADFLSADFAATFEGAPRPGEAGLGSVRLISMDGRRNRAAFAEVSRLIDGAAHAITVVSPYLTFPFTDDLAKAVKRGVAVTLITPWANNKPIVRDALLWTARRAGIAVVLLRAMSHMKGLLVDGRVLVLGSSNFDFASLAAEEEILALITDAAVISDFQSRVIDPARAEERPTGVKRVSALAGIASHLGLRIAERVALAARGARRTARPWPV